LLTAIVAGPASVLKSPPGPRMASVSGKRKRRRGMPSARVMMAMSTGPDWFIWMHETPPTLIEGVAPQVLSF